MPSEEAIPETTPVQPQSMRGFAPVFYPGAMSARSASTVSLGLGEDRADIDFQLPLVAMGRVTGAVLGPDGRPVPNMMVALNDPQHDEFEQGTETDGNGRFQFERVVPGTYAVTAGKGHATGHITFSAKKFSVEDGVFLVFLDKMREVRITGSAIARPPEVVHAETERRSSAPAGSAAGEVTVAGSATSDVVLTLEPPRTVAGRITTEGES
jgi:hypothetical protein